MDTNTQNGFLPVSASPGSGILPQPDMWELPVFDLIDLTVSRNALNGAQTPEDAAEIAKQMIAYCQRESGGAVAPGTQFLIDRLVEYRAAAESEARAAALAAFDARLGELLDAGFAALPEIEEAA